jgi:hypothetical protein
MIHTNINSILRCCFYIILYVNRSARQEHNKTHNVIFLVTLRNKPVLADVGRLSYQEWSECFNTQFVVVYARNA